MNYSDHHSRSY